MKLIVNETNISRVYGCIKAVQGDIANDIRLLEIELKNPLAWTNKAKDAALKPYEDAMDRFLEVESLLTDLFRKHKKDWYKSAFGYIEDKKARIDALESLTELFIPLGFEPKDRSKLDFQEIHRFVHVELRYESKKLEYRDTVESKISYKHHIMAELGAIESRVVIGLILEAPELNLIQFKN